MIYSNERGSIIDANEDLISIIHPLFTSWYYENEKFIIEEHNKRFIEFICFGESTYSKYPKLPLI